MADLVSSRVRKRFGTTWFGGVISEVWEAGDTTFAHIVYSDGDEEDLLVDDARELLVLPAAEPVNDGAAACASRKRTGAVLMTTTYPRLPSSAKENAPPKRCAARVCARCLLPAKIFKKGC